MQYFFLLCDVLAIKITLVLTTVALLYFTATFSLSHHHTFASSYNTWIFCMFFFKLSAIRLFWLRSIGYPASVLLEYLYKSQLTYLKLSRRIALLQFCQVSSIFTLKTLTTQMPIDHYIFLMPLILFNILEARLTSETMLSTSLSCNLSLYRMTLALIRHHILITV